ncbi:hypothetical protein L9F63_023127, partial [Diploptera punctata]
FSPLFLSCFQIFDIVAVTQLNGDRNRKHRDRRQLQDLHQEMATTAKRAKV